MHSRTILSVFTITNHILESHSSPVFQCLPILQIATASDFLLSVGLHETSLVSPSAVKQNCNSMCKSRWPEELLFRIPTFPNMHIISITKLQKWKKLKQSWYQKGFCIYRCEFTSFSSIFFTSFNSFSADVRALRMATCCCLNRITSSSAIIFISTYCFLLISASFFNFPIYNGKQRHLVT